MKLAQEQIDSFRRDGFLHYGRILGDATLALLRHEYDEEFRKAEESTDKKARGLTTEEEDRGAGGHRESARVVLQIMQMCERNLHFRQLLYHSEILDIVEDLIGPNIQLFHDQALYKAPHTGGAVPWHQDNGYWLCRPATLLSCWLTLDDVDSTNGAMQLMPGSHLLPQPHTQTSGTLLEIEDIDESKAAVIDLPAGGCMFHHCETLHYTAPNSTDRQRRAFAIHFMTPGTTRGNRKTDSREEMPVSFNRPILRMRI